MVTTVNFSIFILNFFVLMFVPLPGRSWEKGIDGLCAVVCCQSLHGLDISYRRLSDSASSLLARALVERGSRFALPAPSLRSPSRFLVSALWPYSQMSPRIWLRATLCELPLKSSQRLVSAGGLSVQGYCPRFKPSQRAVVSPMPPSVKTNSYFRKT